MNVINIKALDPEKFGSRRVGHKKKNKQQLDLFAEGKVLQLHSRSVFEEALMLDENGNTEEACRLYHKAAKEEEHAADAYCNLGILKCREDKMAEAVHFLTLGLKHNPRHLEAHFNLANIYAEMGNLELGKLHYEICIKVEPEFTNSYFNLGLTLAAAQKYEEAIEILKQYSELVSPEDGKDATEMILKLQLMLNSTPKCG